MLGQRLPLRGGEARQRLGLVEDRLVIERAVEHGEAVPGVFSSPEQRLPVDQGQDDLGRGDGDPAGLALPELGDHVRAAVDAHDAAAAAAPLRGLGAGPDAAHFLIAALDRVGEAVLGSGELARLPPLANVGRHIDGDAVDRSLRRRPRPGNANAQRDGRVIGAAAILERALAPTPVAQPHVVAPAVGGRRLAQLDEHVGVTHASVARRVRLARAHLPLDGRLLGGRH